MAEEVQQPRFCSVRPLGQTLVIRVPDGLPINDAEKLARVLLSRQPRHLFPDYQVFGQTADHRMVIRGLGNDVLEIKRFSDKINRRMERAISWRRFAKRMMRKPSREEVRRDKRGHLFGAAIALSLLMATEAGAASYPWSAWEYSESHIKNEQNVGAWESFRVIDDNLGVKAIVSTGLIDVVCHVHYYTIERTLQSYIPAKGKSQFVDSFDGLPQALTKCRRAVERRIRVQSAGVYNPETGEAERSRRVLSLVMTESSQPKAESPPARIPGRAHVSEPLPEYNLTNTGPIYGKNFTIEESVSKRGITEEFVQEALDLGLKRNRMHYEWWDQPSSIPGATPPFLWVTVGFQGVGEDETMVGSLTVRLEVLRQIQLTDQFWTFMTAWLRSWSGLVTNQEAAREYVHLAVLELAGELADNHRRANTIEARAFIASTGVDRHLVTEFDKKVRADKKK